MKKTESEIWSYLISIRPGGVTAHRVSEALTGPGETKTQHVWVAYHTTEPGSQGITKVTCAAQTKRDHLLYFGDFEIPGSEGPSN